MNDSKSPSTPLTLAEEFAAAQAWWQDAGVDQDYEDVAKNWLAQDDAPDMPRNIQPAFVAGEPPEKKIAAAPQRQKPGGAGQDWPTDLATFQSWWLAEPTLDEGGSFPRIPPRGRHRPALMVIVAEPEPQDSDTLLSGPLGKFLSNILAAADIGADGLYLASALPRHTPMADFPRLHADGLADVLHHHIKLAEPERMCVLGRNIWPLLGHDVAQGAAFLPDFDHEGRSVPVLGAEGLAELLRSTARRERFWRRWLQWTDG